MHDGLASHPVGSSEAHTVTSSASTETKVKRWT